MFPLALLQEGEVAEIINPIKSNQIVCQSNNPHVHGDCCCAVGCKNCSCRHNSNSIFHAHSPSYLQDMGLSPGKQVEIITNSANGPLVLRVDECRIAIGRNVAMKIYVRRNTP